MVGWDGLVISNERTNVIGCPLVEILRWLGKRKREEVGRHGVNVSDATCVHRV